MPSKSHSSDLNDKQREAYYETSQEKLLTLWFCYLLSYKHRDDFVCRSVKHNCIIFYVETTFENISFIFI